MDKKFEKLLTDEMLGRAEVMPIISLDENPTEIQLNPGDVLPILPLRNIVMFPGVLVPVAVARPKSLRLIRKLKDTDGLLGACTQIDKMVDEPGIEHLYKTGVVHKSFGCLKCLTGLLWLFWRGKNVFT